MKAYEYSFVIKRSNGSTEVIPVDFKRSIHAKSIKITPQLTKKIIKVTYPIYTLHSRAVAFLEKQKDWIAKQLEKVPEKTTISDGAKITFMEKEYKIVHIPNARRGVWFEENYIFVSGNIEFLNRRVKDFLKAEMKKYFTSQAHIYASKINKKFEKITVKDTTSRWGSCTSSGNIAFSWRLGFAPIFVTNYIIAHEIAHLAELNHSYKFWQVVRSIYDGNINEAQRWLSRNGIFLYSID